MKSNKRELILYGDLYKTILILAVPIMLNNFVQTIYNLTDTFFVSKLGGIEVAAITLIWPAVFLLISLTAGINIAGGALIAQNFGAGRYIKSKVTAGQLLLVTQGIAFIIGIIGFISAEKLVYYLGGRGQLLQESVSYFKIISLGTPLTSYNLSYAAIKQGEGDTVSPMILSVVSVASNIILDPIFIFTLGLGVKGAAYATLVARAIICMISIYKLHIKNTSIRIGYLELKVRKKIIKKIMEKGIPISFGNSTTAIGFLVLNSFVVKYGADVLAAFGIGNRIISIIVMPAMGIGGAVATIVGQNYGNGNIKRIKETLNKSLIIIGVFSVFGTFLFWFKAKVFMEIFIKVPHIVEMGEYYIKLISLTIITLGTFQGVSGVFQGLSHSKKVMSLNMIRLWAIRIPLILILGLIPSFGEKSIWYSMLISNFACAIISLIMYKMTRVIRAA